MPGVVARIESWGKKEGMAGSITKILRTAVRNRLMFSAIAESAGCSPQALRYQLDRLGINTFKPTFESRVQELGYKDVKDFFTDKKNVYKSMKELSEITGFCCPTVSRHYHKFEAEAALSQEKK